MEKVVDDPKKRAIEAAGSAANLARLLGVTRQAVWRWRKIPLKHMKTLEKLLGIPREKLRPDIFGP